MQRDFFTLLNAGLQLQPFEDLKLSPNPDWQHIYTIANQQTVTGIIADGISSLGIQSTLPPEILNQFVCDTTHIARTNLKMLEVQAKVCRTLEQNDLLYVLLKGQCVAQCYPNPLSRISGDIDILLPPDHYEIAKRLLTDIDTNPTDKPLAGEFSIFIDNVQVELHDNIYAGINSHCVSRFPELTARLFTERRRLSTLPDAPYVPSVNFDAIYLLLHTARHLGSFGISLRQVLDWQMHLLKYKDQIDHKWLNDTIDRLHLRNLWTRFSDYENDPELLSIIMASGNFGCISKYKSKRFSNKIFERIYRTHFLLQQANKIGVIDREFAKYLRKREIKSFFQSIVNSQLKKPHCKSAPRSNHNDAGL